MDGGDEDLPRHLSRADMDSKTARPAKRGASQYACDRFSIYVYFHIKMKSKRKTLGHRYIGLDIDI